MQQPIPSFSHHGAQAGISNGLAQELLPPIPQLPSRPAGLAMTGSSLKHGSLPATSSSRIDAPSAPPRAAPRAGPAAAASSSTALLHDSLDDDHDADGDDPNKRRRVARACDSCRKKKVRCDGIDPPAREACTNCITYGHSCTFLNAAKRRPPPRSYVEALEARMAKMEALVASLAPGVDFVDAIGPPVVLPGEGDNQGDEGAAAAKESAAAEAAATNAAVASAAAAALSQAHAYGNGLLRSSTSTGNVRSCSGQSLKSCPAPLTSASTDMHHPDEDEEEPENIGILLQHKIDQLDLNKTPPNASSSAAESASASALSPTTASDGIGTGGTPSSGIVASTDLGESTSKTAAAASTTSEASTQITSTLSARLATKTPLQILSTGKSYFRGGGTDERDNIVSDSDPTIFFGHSSNFMLYPQLEKLTLGMPEDQKTKQLHFLHDRCQVPEIYAETVGPKLDTIELHWPESDLEAKLVDAYFQHVHSSMPILNEAVFRDELQNRPECRKDRNWLGLALGVFSVASRFVDDDRLITFPRQYARVRWLYGTHWLETRKALGLSLFAQSLNLAQLQGLILSSYFLQATPVGGTMGWAVLGVAIRLLQAHGVHRRAVNRARQLPIHVDEAWKRCFWVCYNIDVEMSSSMGRPIGTHEDDFDLDYPLEVDDDVLWEAGKAGARNGWPSAVPGQHQQPNGSSPKPTAPASGSTAAGPPGSSAGDARGARPGSSSPASGHDDASGGPSAEATMSSPSSGPEASTSGLPPDPVALQGDRPTKFVTSFIATLKLKLIMARILRTIYMLPKARIARGYVGSQAPQFVVAEIDSALNDWINWIPSRIRFDPHETDDGLLIQTSQIHMLYYSAQILTHRPFLSATKHDSPNFASVAICTNAARSCSHILDTLRKRNLLEHPHMSMVGHAFISGCVLLLVVWSARKSGARLSSSTLSDVGKCVEALRAMEKSTHPATVLGAALSEMIIAAEIPFAAAEQQAAAANHKRSRDDSIHDGTGSPSAATTASSSPGAATAPVRSTQAPAGTSTARARRQPRGSGRRSANSSSTSLATAGGGQTGSRMSVSGDAPPLPLSTQELVAPFHSAMSLGSTPENQTRASRSAAGIATSLGTSSQAVPVVESQQQASAPQGNVFGGGPTASSSTTISSEGLFHGGLPSGLPFPLPGMMGSSIGPMPPASHNASGIFSSSTDGGGGGGGQHHVKQGSGSAPGSPPRPTIDFTSSSYDPMRVAAEQSADFSLMGNPASWTSSAFDESSFPAFADVSMAMAGAQPGGAGGAGGVDGLMPPGMGMGMSMAMGMGMGMGGGMGMPMGMGGASFMPTGFEGMSGLLGGMGANAQGATPSSGVGSGSLPSFPRSGPGLGPMGGDQVSYRDMARYAALLANREGGGQDAGRGAAPGGRGSGAGANADGEGAERCLEHLDEHIQDQFHGHGHRPAVHANHLAAAAALMGGGAGGGDQPAQQMGTAAAGAQPSGNTLTTTTTDPFAMLFSQSFF